MAIGDIAPIIAHLFWRANTDSPPPDDGDRDGSSVASVLSDLDGRDSVDKRRNIIAFLLLRR